MRRNVFSNVTDFRHLQETPPMENPEVHLFDTHSHMYLSAFDEDRDRCMERAEQAGVMMTALPNIDGSTIEPLRRMRERYPRRTIGMMGLHPSSVKEDYERELEIIGEELRRGGYRAVGEIGIDLYWDKTHQTAQTDAFRQQIRWAKKLKLPIVIHARDSFDEIFAVMDQEYERGLTGIFHCFTGDETQARRALGYEGFYLGIGGVVTFKNSDLGETLESIGPERLVLETDAPYLTPHPHRGKRNETAYTALVAAKLGEVLGCDVEEVARRTTANGRRVFQMDAMD